jgi:hypothetical protein
VTRPSPAAWWKEQFRPATVRRRVHRGAAVACLIFSAVLAVAIFFPGRWRIFGILVKLDTIRNPLLEVLASALVFVATREGSFDRTKAALRLASRVWSGWDARDRVFALVLAAQIGAGAVHVAKSPDERLALDRWMRRVSGSSFEDAARGTDWYLQREACFEECRRVLPGSARVLYHGGMEVQLLSYALYPRPVFMPPDEWYAAWISHQRIDRSLPEDPLFPSGMPGPPAIVPRETFLRGHRITHEVTFLGGDAAQCRIEAVR